MLFIGCQWILFFLVHCVTAEAPKSAQSVSVGDGTRICVCLILDPMLHSLFLLSWLFFLPSFFSFPLILSPTPSNNDSNDDGWHLLSTRYVQAFTHINFVSSLSNRLNWGFLLALFQRWENQGTEEKLNIMSAMTSTAAQKEIRRHRKQTTQIRVTKNHTWQS